MRKGDVVQHESVPQGHAMLIFRFIIQHGEKLHGKRPRRIH
jgi:hypothetical protein